jgi:hypothetical protein
MELMTVRLAEHAVHRTSLPIGATSFLASRRLSISARTCAAIATTSSPPAAAIPPTSQITSAARLTLSASRSP